MLGPLKKLKSREGSRKKLALFLFFWKYSEISIFVGKINGSMNSGRIPEKIAFFFVFWKNPEISILLVKLNGQWILNRESLGEVRNIFKNYFHSQTLQKIVTKLGQFKKLKSRELSLFLNCPNFITIFCRVWKWK